LHPDDTIVAVATPSGRGGIGVVRLSGPDALKMATAMLRLPHELAPRHATVAELIEPRTAEAAVPHRSAAQSHSGCATQPFQPGEKIDEVVVTYFVKPLSYTAEDVLEISAHGAPVVLRHIVDLALAGGARLAEPGEFTLRAFLNGRIDLTQAEAVRDLIESQTLYQAKVAVQQLEGALANRLRPIKQRLVELIAQLEAGVDFAEDDVPVMPAEQTLARIAAVRAPLRELAESFAYGKVVHEGLTLAIVGRPNVGKSSLFNRLVERDRAIVTATPGTTRDLVSETVAIGGIPVRLVDTAGIREASDEAESIGVKKTWEAVADADVVLVVTDHNFDFGKGARSPRTGGAISIGEALPQAVIEDTEIIRRASGGKRLVVANKCDLYRPRGTLFVNVHDNDVSDYVHETSAVTGYGLPELRAAILKKVGGNGTQPEAGFLTNARQQSLVTASISALDRARTAVEQDLPHEMLLLDLYAALRPLDEITGATTADDILNLIFSSFCIGK